MGIKKNNWRSTARTRMHAWFYTFTLPWRLVAACLYEGREKVSSSKLATRPQSWTHVYTKGTWRGWWLWLASFLRHWIIVGVTQWASECSLLSALCELRSKGERGVVNVYPNHLWLVRMCADGDVHGTLYICFVLCEDLERPPTLLHFMHHSLGWSGPM